MPEWDFSEVPAAELSDVIVALKQAGLPVDDIDGERMTFFRLSDDQGNLGWAGLERHGPDALLRSVLVAPGQRGGGIGSQLVRRVTAVAAEEGLERLWLLTETAAPFFARLGFATTARSDAPPELSETAEFRSLCPASATCMTMALELS